MRIKKTFFHSSQILIIAYFLFLFAGCEDDTAESEDLINQTTDCMGTINGSAMYDSCGVCDDDPLNDCLQDCEGVWGGSSRKDSCDVCDDNTDNDCALINLTPHDTTIGVNETVDVEMDFKGLSDSIFAISMQVIYDNSILSFDDSTGYNLGDFFDDVISFINEDSSSIYFSITLMQGATMVDGSGKIISFEFQGIAPGSSEIEVLSSDTQFYDAQGNEVSISNLEFSSSEINVNNGI